MPSCRSWIGLPALADPFAVRIGSPTGARRALTTIGTAAWVAFHLDAAAARAVGVDWPRVYHRPAARLRWGLALLCAAATLALWAWPPPRLLKQPLQAADAGKPSAPADPSSSSALVPQIVEGMRAMRSGRTPSPEQLAAIAQALEMAKGDPLAHRQIEGRLTQSQTRSNDPTDAFDSDSLVGASSDDLHNGFELADLDWAYQEAIARVRADERTPPDAGGEVTTAEDAPDGKADERPGESAASGALNGVPIEADTRGQAMNFLAPTPGRQQASADSGSTKDPAKPDRAATLAVTLRSEVVHARSDGNGTARLPTPPLRGGQLPPASRRPLASCRSAACHTTGRAQCSHQRCPTPVERWSMIFFSVPPLRRRR